MGWLCIASTSAAGTRTTEAMVEAEEIGAIPLFSGLEAAERERLARAAADIRLGVGEYAVHEGDERALYAVLEGRVETVKMIDGMERVIGERGPGVIFGEVPITLGTPFPGGFRAAEPSRVMRIEAHDYHAVAATAPEIAKQVGALAQRRLARRSASTVTQPIRRSTQVLECTPSPPTGSRAHSSMT